MLMGLGGWVAAERARYVVFAQKLKEMNDPDIIGNCLARGTSQVSSFSAEGIAEDFG